MYMYSLNFVNFPNKAYLGKIENIQNLEYYSSLLLIQFVISFF